MPSIYCSLYSPVVLAAVLLFILIVYCMLILFEYDLRIAKSVIVKNCVMYE